MEAFCSYSVLVQNPIDMQRLLQIPCSGRKVADQVSQNLLTLFPQSEISIKEYSTPSPKQRSTKSDHTVNLLKDIDNELEKSLF